MQRSTSGKKNKTISNSGLFCAVSGFLLPPIFPFFPKGKKAPGSEKHNITAKKSNNYTWLLFPGMVLWPCQVAKATRHSRWDQKSRFDNLVLAVTCHKQKKRPSFEGLFFLRLLYNNRMNTKHYSFSIIGWLKNKGFHSVPQLRAHYENCRFLVGTKCSFRIIRFCNSFQPL